MFSSYASRRLVPRQNVFANALAEANTAQQEEPCAPRAGFVTRTRDLFASSAFRQRVLQRVDAWLRATDDIAKSNQWPPIAPDAQRALREQIESRAFDMFFPNLQPATAADAPLTPTEFELLMRDVLLKVPAARTFVERYDAFVVDTSPLLAVEKIKQDWWTWTAPPGQRLLPAPLDMAAPGGTAQAPTAPRPIGLPTGPGIFREPELVPADL